MPWKFVTGAPIWWTSAGLLLSFSLQYGSWWAMFGCSTLALDRSIEHQSFMSSALLCLPGMLLATLSHFYCLCCCVAASHWLATSSDTTWTWGQWIKGRLMTKFPGYPAGDSKKPTPIWISPMALTAILLFQVNTL